MRVLALDISTKAGYALLDGEPGQTPQILETGLIKLDGTVFSFGRYPKSYYLAACTQATSLRQIVQRAKPDVVVVEETNLGKNRYTQKLLEFIHAFFVFGMEKDFAGTPVIYISSSAWRHALGLQMSKEDKKNNALLSKAKREAIEAKTKLDKGALGVRGRVTKKHLAIRYVNATFGLSLRLKDNDIADAVALGTAYLRGADTCDGT